MKGKIEWPYMNMYQKSAVVIHIEFIQVLMNKWSRKNACSIQLNNCKRSLQFWSCLLQHHNLVYCGMPSVFLKYILNIITCQNLSTAVFMNLKISPSAEWVSNIMFRKGSLLKSRLWNFYFSLLKQQ